MYGVMLDLLDTFYPESEITVTSSDPPCVTPTVKTLLRRKNRLMRAGRTDEAGSIAARICTIITRSNTRWLRTVNTQKSAKAAWAKVRDVIKGSAIRASDHQIDGHTAQSLDNHYAAIYPALLQPCPSLDFSDQFAFRPSGSTTAAIVALLHTVRTMLDENDFVHVFSFDFSKALDTVRHASLMTKFAQLEILNCVYSWVNDFFDNRQPCTLHEICRTRVSSRHYLCQRHSGISVRTNLVHSHRG